VHDLISGTTQTSTTSPVLSSHPSRQPSRRRATRLGVAAVAAFCLVGAGLLGPTGASADTGDGTTPTDDDLQVSGSTYQAFAGPEATVRAGGPAGRPASGGVGTADHEGNPSPAELLEQCENGIDYCEFHPSGENVQRGEYALAGTAENCAADPQTRNIAWSRTEGESNSLGMSISATAGVKGIFEATVQTTYGHEWSWSETSTNSVDQTVNPGKGVAIYVASDRSTVTGQWELHFGDRYEGHYYWYIDNAEISAPTFQTPWHTRTEEIDAHC